MPVFVGRTEPLARLTAAYRAIAEPPSGDPLGWAHLVLVTGEAGIGKTALLTRFASQIAADGATVVWGTCWDGDQAPAWWSWTQALRALLDRNHDLVESATPELAAILPELATPARATGPPSSARDAALRVRVFDAAGQFLGHAAAQRPVVVVLDDLQWADSSTVELLRFLTHQPQLHPLLLIGAYRPDEPPPRLAAALADLATAAELMPLRGLSAEEVADLVRAITGAPAGDQSVQLVHERSAGHPFYARELCQLLATTGSATDVPTAVREVIDRRLSRLSQECATLLGAAAVAGMTLLPAVLADVSGSGTAQVSALVTEATTAGFLALGATPEKNVRFVHDLYRETIYTDLTPARRISLHHRVATALLDRRARGSPVFAAELAYHFTAAIPEAGTASALGWAHAAARADAARFAFAEAAGHLTRLRSAISAASERLPEEDLVRVLTAEADLRLRSGDATEARALLHTAWIRATKIGKADLLGAVALGLDRIDARFAMPRADLVRVLDNARRALTGSDTATEANVAAALARQLSHSIPADRPLARPLAAQAVHIARTLEEPATLASCLLAQHDALWTPGTAPARAAIAAEIAELSKQANDEERGAQALLLSASAQLESASPAFRATLIEYFYLTQRLRQPRHDYLLRTRQAALALLDGDIETGERLSAEAAILGETVGDTDTGNVRMSQRLEIVRARNQPAELDDMAAAAVRWWIGAPAHAHAVAAGFYARAGDLDAARQKLDTVLALEDWRADRSYLWSIFVSEMAIAAIALCDRALCRQLLEDLLPLVDTCAVNAALVCFMGAHAHRVGLLYAALDRPEVARQRLEQALGIHRRLGARAWQAETHQALASLGGVDAPEHARRAATLRAELGLATSTASQRDGLAELRRLGDMWQASFGGHTVYLRDIKGLHDLAALLAHPGRDLSALDLTGAPPTELTTTDPVLDRAALAAYRRRLAELDDDLATAQQHADVGRQQGITDERERLLTELRQATQPDGTSRAFSNTAAERARKAVTARIRDAIRRIGEAYPELGSHLNRTIRTGTFCRYEPTP